jgi:phage-related protein
VAANAGYATLTILPSAKGFASALQGEVGPGMTSAGSDGGKRSGGAFAGAFKSLVGPALALVSAAAIGGFVKDSIMAAGDLEQSVGAIESVFKGSAGQMLDWSKTASTSVGLTSNEFNELGTLIGSQLKNGGMAMDELGPKTHELIGLGADLSSMFGGTTKEAVEALSASLKGETDPIERYGVSLSAAKVEAKAAEMGFSKVGGELSNQAKQAATLALIMDQTKDAQGNFNREQDTFSHKMQVSSALWGDISAKIGTLFLPAATAVVGAVSDRILPAINGLMDGMLAFQSNAPPADVVKALGLDPSQGFGAAIAEGIGGIYAFSTALVQGGDDVTSSGFAGVMELIGLKLHGFVDVIRDVAGRVGLALAQLWNGFKNPPEISAVFGPLIGPFYEFGAKLREVADIAKGGVKAFWEALKVGGDDVTSTGFAGTMETLGLAVRNTFDSLAPVVRDAFATLGPAFAGVLPVVISAVQAFSPLGIVLKVLPQILPTIVSALATIVPVVGQVLAQIIPLGAELVQTLVPVFVELVGTVLPPVIGALSSIVAAVAPLVVVLLGRLIPTIQMLLPVVSVVFGVIADVVRSAMQVVKGVIEVVTGIISGDWGKVWSGLGDIFSGAWDLVVGVISGAFAIIGTYIGAIFGPIVSAVGDWLGQVGAAFANGWNQIVSFVTTVVSAIVTPIVDGFNALVGFVGGVANAIVSPIVAAWTWVYNLVVAILQAFWAEHGAQLTAVWNVVSSIFSAIGAFIANTWNAIYGTVAGAVGAVVGFISSGFNAAWGFISSIFNRVFGFIASVWGNISGAVSGAVNAVFGTISWGFNAAWGVISSVFGRVAGFLGGVWSSVVGGVSSMIGQVGGYFSGLWGTITGAFAGAASWLWNAGRNIVEGLISGVKSLAGTIGSAFLSVIPGWIVEPFKAALGIHSPSRVFRGYGVNIGEGLVLGMGDMQDAVQGAADGLAPKAPAFASPKVAPGGLTGAVAAATSTTATGSSPVNVYGNVYGDPEDVVEELEARRRHSAVTNGLRAIALGV